MQATSTQKQSWKDAAMEKAEYITDIWEVVKVYMGRAAEWVLFLCMVINIIQMLPGINIAIWLVNTVLGVQVVMLDIGGMSLSSMAQHAKERGATDSAKKAAITSKFLIGLMITTLLLVAAGVLFPAIKQYTDMAEKGLILVRVVMTVIYGHVIHSLRSSSHQAIVPPMLPVSSSTELEKLIRDILVPVLQEYRAGEKTDIEQQMKKALSAFAVSQEKKALPDVPKRKQTPATMKSAKVKRIEEGSAEREERIAEAYQELLSEGIRPTSDTLSRRARCNRAIALSWLKDQKATG